MSGRKIYVGLGTRKTRLQSTCVVRSEMKDCRSDTVLVTSNVQQIQSPIFQFCVNAFSSNSRSKYDGTKTSHTNLTKEASEIIEPVSPDTDLWFSSTLTLEATRL